MKVGLSRALALLSLLLAAGAAAEGPGRAQIPDTPLGRRVAGFVSAFNSGDEKAMIGFWTADFTPESLRQRPVEARLQFYRRMQEEMKTIAVAAVEESTPTAIALKMKTETGGYFQFRFEAEADPPHRLNLGSINKIFTKTAIAQLAAAGKLSLTNTIRKRLRIPSSLTRSFPIAPSPTRRRAAGCAPRCSGTPLGEAPPAADIRRPAT